MNHLNYILKQLLSYQETLEEKLSLLTEIGLVTRNDQLFKATEEVRNELVSGEEIQKIGPDLLRNNESSQNDGNFFL